MPNDNGRKREHDYALLSLHGIIADDVILKHSANGLAIMQIVVYTRPLLKDPALNKWLETEKFSLPCRASGADAITIAHNYRRGYRIKLRGYMGLLKTVGFVLYVTDVLPQQQPTNGPQAAQTAPTQETEQEAPEALSVEEPEETEPEAAPAEADGIPEESEPQEAETPTEVTEPEPPAVEPEAGEDTSPEVLSNDLYYKTSVLPSNIRKGDDHFDLDGQYLPITDVREEVQTDGSTTYSICLMEDLWVDDAFDQNDRVPIRRRKM